MDKPKLGNIRQIGIVVRDIEKACAVFENIFGIGPFEICELNKNSKVDFKVHGIEDPIRLKLAFAQSGNLEIELIQITEGKTSHTEYLEKHGEGIHHLGFLVDDYDETIGKLKCMGINLKEAGISRGKNKFAYMENAKTSGVIFEIIKRP